MRPLSRRRGFSLIELMIVLMLFVILISLLAPNLIRARYRAQLTSCMDQMKNLATVMEQYSVEHKVYPTTLSAAFLTAYLSKGAVVCPSSQTPYQLQVDNVEHVFTLSCAGGVHHVALPGFVSAGYPQFSHLTGHVVLK